MKSSLLSLLLSTALATTIDYYEPVGIPVKSHVEGLFSSVASPGRRLHPHSGGHWPRNEHGSSGSSGSSERYDAEYDPYASASFSHDGSSGSSEERDPCPIDYTKSKYDYMFTILCTDNTQETMKRSRCGVITEEAWSCTCANSQRSTCPIVNPFLCRSNPFCGGNADQFCCYDALTTQGCAAFSKPNYCDTNVFLNNAVSVSICQSVPDYNHVAQAVNEFFDDANVRPQDYTDYPTPAPSASPSEAPSAVPSEAPSAVPSAIPSAIPSEAPSEAPSDGTIDGGVGGEEEDTK